MKQKAGNAALGTLLFEVGRLMKRELSEEGWGPASYLQLEALRHVAEGRARSMHELAEYLRIARPSATALANALVKDKLLARKEDMRDRRKVNIALTARGHALLKHAAARRTAAFARITAKLSQKEHAELARLLTRLITSNS